MPLCLLAFSQRIGYLAASQCFHEGTDVIMLTTNQIRKVNSWFQFLVSSYLYFQRYTIFYLKKKKICWSGMLLTWFTVCCHHTVWRTDAVLVLWRCPWCCFMPTLCFICLKNPVGINSPTVFPKDSDTLQPPWLGKFCCSLRSNLFVLKVESNFLPPAEGTTMRCMWHRALRAWLCLALLMWSPCTRLHSVNSHSRRAKCAVPFISLFPNNCSYGFIL